MPSLRRIVSILTILLASPGAATAARWVLLGPVVEQPATEIEIGGDGSPALYGIVGAGVVRSGDVGATWTLGDAGLSGELRPFLLRMDPHRQGVLYLAVNAAGVYRSFDGGAHWHPAANRGLPFRASTRMSSLAVDPTTPSTLILGTSSDWIYRSDDGGDTWHPTAGVPPNRAVHGLAVDPTHPDTLYVAASGIDEFGPGAFPAAYRSDDGGASWQALPVEAALDLAQLTDVVVAPGNPGTVYLASFDGGVIRSTDRGASWTHADAGLPVGDLGVTVRSLKVDPRDPTTLLAGTDSGLAEDGVYRTVDRGEHWQPVGQWPSLRAPSDVELHPGDPALVLAAPGPFLSPAEPEGPWRPRPPRLPQPLDFVTPDLEDPQTLYAGSVVDGTRRSRDGGVTWHPFGPTAPEAAAPASGLVVDPSDPATVYLLGTVLLRSRDGGATWERLGEEAFLSGPRRLVTDPRDPKLLYDLGASGLFRSLDGGDTWSHLPGPDAPVTALALDPSDPAVVYAGTTVGGPGTEPGDPEGFCRSDDRGESWTCPPTGLPDGEVTAVAADPAEPARHYLSFAASQSAEGQVLRSVDGGATWQPASSGLPVADVLDLAVDPAAAGTVWAGTRGHGVFRSTDGAASWSPAGPGLGLLVATDLSFGAGGLFAATSRGAFRLDPSDASGEPLPPDDQPWLENPVLPGFRFKVRIDQGGGARVAGAQEPECLPETVCVSGAVPGRSEVFLRIVGPKPNGWLWPTLVKFTTSRVEVWIQQTASGRLRWYELRGASPGFDELPGLFDRFGFGPE